MYTHMSYTCIHDTYIYIYKVHRHIGLCPAERPLLECLGRDLSGRPKLRRHGNVSVLVLVLVWVAGSVSALVSALEFVLEGG